MQPVLDLRLDACVPVGRAEIMDVLAGVGGRLDVVPEARRRMGLGGEHPLEAAVSLVDDSTISELNSSYRGKNGPTDVLSFAQGEGDGEMLIPWLLGDVVISVETANAQAISNGWGWLDEFRFLLIHGLLHLLGYDHIESEDRVRMELMEQRLWKACGGQGTLRGDEELELA